MDVGRPFYLPGEVELLHDPVQASGCYQTTSTQCLLFLFCLFDTLIFKNIVHGGGPMEFPAL